MMDAATTTDTPMRCGWCLEPAHPVGTTCPHFRAIERRRATTNGGDVLAAVLSDPTGGQ